MSSNTPTALPQPNKPPLKPSYRSLFRKKWFTPPLPSSQMDLTGRTIIITGSNTGLGFEAAKAFCNMNFGPKTLILAVRSVERGEAAKRAIQDDRNNRNNGLTDIQVWPLDLSSFKSVKAFASRANQQLERLDIFVENAGVGNPSFRQTNDGWENMLQTNVISTFMLAALLMPLLLKTSELPAPVEGVRLKPHLVILASATHAFSRFSQKSQPEILNALNDREQFDRMDHYSATKLVSLLLTRQLGKTMGDEASPAEPSVVIDCLEPGFCKSGLMRSLPWIIRAPFLGLFALPTAEGAKNIIWASLNDNIPSGAYIDRCEVANIVGYASEPEAFPTQEKLWKEVGDIITPIAPETKDFWRI